MKEKTKRNKGITLIALILTIIVLLILAVVAINAVKGDGIIARAKNAKSDYSRAQANEQSTLQGYLDQLEETKLASTKLKDNLYKVLSSDANITLEDDFGNKIKVPAGFRILVDDTTSYTADTIDVTKGIVVEDENFNQFVWIPVGTIYTDTEKTEANTKIIELGRYEVIDYRNNTLTQIQKASECSVQVKVAYEFTEDTIANHNAIYNNAIAKNIEDFCYKTIKSGGYYIGRYEARTVGNERKEQTDSLTEVSLSGYSYVYNYVTQPQASKLCQTMYINKPFESDLVNSYAWDTAELFFKECGDFSWCGGDPEDNLEFSNTGTSPTDIEKGRCNVYNMGSNVAEWSTETGTTEYPCVHRGREYDGIISYYGSDRGYGLDGQNSGFRPVLYM